MLANSGLRAALACATLLGLCAAPAPAAEKRHAAIVMDANTGVVLYEQSADEPRHPASLAKMMTLYLTFEEIEAGRLSYGTKIPVSAKAAAAPPSKLKLAPGDEIELIDAIKALITKSANDVAMAVAERIGGTEAGFVRRMNERARQLGMRNTTFTNPSGLPNPRQISTARDMLTLGLRLIDDFPGHYHLFALTSFTFRGKTHTTHNGLLRGFPGVDGIKTGYTRSSGYNLVSSVRADGKHVVAALFGGASATTRNAHMRSLLFRALQRASTERTRRPGPAPVARREKAPEPTETRKAEAGKPRKTAEAPRPKPRQTKEAEAPVARAPAAPPPSGVGGPPEPEISLAKVRVLTAMPPSESPSPGAAPPPQPSAAAAVPKLDLMALREAISSGEATEPPQPPTPGPGRAPSSIEDIISANAAGGPQELGRPPSTLDRQAEALGFSNAAVASPASTFLQSPTPPSTHTPPETRLAAAPVSTAGYEIQIGAYASAAEAENRIAAAKSRAGKLLNGHGSFTIPVQKGDRQIFRARFGGFDEDGASNACLELRRLAIDCFVMKAD